MDADAEASTPASETTSLPLPTTARPNSMLGPRVSDQPDEFVRERSFDLEGFNYELERMRNHMAKSKRDYGKTTGLKASRSVQDLISSSASPPALSAEAAAQASRLYQAHLKYLNMQSQHQRTFNASFSGSGSHRSDTPDLSKDSTKNDSASPQTHVYKLQSRGSSCLPPLDRIPSPSSTNTPPQVTNTPPQSGSGSTPTATKSDSPTFSYPSTNATLMILLTNDGQHGSLHRSRPIPTAPDVATQVPSEILKKKPVGVINSLFSSANTFLSPPGLVLCVIVLVKRRLYFFDVAKKNGLRMGRVAGPIASDTLFAAAPRFSPLASQGSQGSQGSLSVTAVGGFRKDSKKASMMSPASPANSESSTGSSSSSFISSPSTLYSPELLTQKPVLILDLRNACVAEDGVWMLRLSGRDMTRSSSYCDVYLQLVDCDEMLRWLQVLRAAAR
ncbi:hypothetical protein HDU83_000867 [Entophlyctis luteolus]|nr:hypothetical protein HDU82_003752 [Entophlyctis luteolus]KAJ3356516.1 hypothetical protein HDU83_000867 [Entophlyctis luteolus]